jgi:hypothetical protein
MTREEAVELLLSGDVYVDCPTCSDGYLPSSVIPINCHVCNGRRRIWSLRVLLARARLGLPPIDPVADGSRDDDLIDAMLYAV